MDSKVILSGIVIAVLLMGSSTVFAQPPPMPAAFYGTVTIGGSPAQDGTVVSAWIGEVEYARATTSDVYGPGSYSLTVPADDPTTPDKEGGVDDDDIVFYVAGIEAAEATFESGKIARLDLAVAASPAAFEVSNLSITPASIEAGESVSISVDITNTGNLEGTYTLTLLIDGAVEATKDVTLAGGATASVTFRITKNVAGTYGVEVDGLTGSFQVTEPTEPPTTPPEEFAEFTITSLTIIPSEVLVGDQVAIIVDVQNVGNVEGTYTLTLQINGVLTQTRDVTLAGGASETVTFIVVENVEGTYNVEVDGLTGSFTVVAPPLPAAFTVSSLTISPSEVEVGEEVTISVVVQNTGELEGTYTVTLRINGVIEDIENVTLAGGTTKSVTFRVAEGTGGTYNVEVDGLTGTFVVTEPAPPQEPTPTPTTEPLIGLWITGGIIAAAVIISVAVFYVRRGR
jgi:uncharacterized membrane protein